MEVFDEEVDESLRCKNCTLNMLNEKIVLQKYIICDILLNITITKLI